MPLLTSAQEKVSRTQAEFANVLDIRPGVKGAESGYFFTDLGGWHGYGMNPAASQELWGGFRGPVVMVGRPGIRWLSDMLERFTLSDGEGQPIPYRKLVTAEYQPGRLLQTLDAGDFEVRQVEIAISPRTTMTETRVRNRSAAAKAIKPTWGGTVTLKDAKVSADKGRLLIEIDGGKRCCVVSLPEKVKLSGQGYVAEGGSAEIAPGKEVVFRTFTSYCPDGGPEKALAESDKHEPSRSDSALVENSKRWQGYLDRVLGANTPYMKIAANRDWAVKSLMTLHTNWRSAAGDLLHGGMYPAADRFDAFWAWDSWEHAVAAAIFNPELAKDQMRTLFDYQTPEGMIVDLIALEKKDNNNACSKPPIAGWAAYMVFQRTGDKDFAREMYPKLAKYHRWRYEFRDHDKNGLCEYGGTGDSVHYGQWESGMDVAVKFDGVKMLKNAEGAWSFDQESVELNSYLCAEKFYLAALADAIGQRSDARKFRDEAMKLREMIRSKFFDEGTGFFYDRKLGTGDLVKVADVSGWIPLLSKVATPQQAARVKSAMFDPKLFGDYYPFSSLNHQHPNYHPEQGYFRGQTWMNYAYFGIRGFKNYGFTADAERLTREMPRKLQGLDQRGPAIRENYSSAIGTGMGAQHFGWSSAFSILLLTEDADRFSYVPDGER